MTVADADKVAFLGVLDREARRLDPRVKQVMASLAGVHEVILVMHSQRHAGRRCAAAGAGQRVSVIVEDSGRREQGYVGMRRALHDGRTARAAPTCTTCRAQAVRAALRQSRGGAGAGRHDDGRARARAGPASCCTRPSATGSRATSTARAPRPSPGGWARRSRARSAPSSTTVRWRGAAARSTSTTRARRRSCTTLIENGVLKGYMQDKLNARLMGVAPTGNGRRESFAHMTLPRMTNTYMLAGPHDPGGDHRFGREGPVCREFRRRPGRHHLRQVRVLGQRGLSDRERQDHARRSRVPR